MNLHRNMVPMVLGMLLADMRPMYGAPTPRKKKPTKRLKHPKKFGRKKKRQ